MIALNFFGITPKTPQEESYNPSLFAHKIRSVGVWFSNYSTSGMSNTPRVYLIPAGNDVFRSPTDGWERQWALLARGLYEH